MKTAGGILLIIGGALGMIGDVLLLIFGSVASRAFSPDHVHMSKADLAQIREGIPVLERDAIISLILALILLVLGVLVIRASQSWLGLIALVLAVFSFVTGSHVSGVICLIGALLALFGSAKPAPGK